MAMTIRETVKKYNIRIKDKTMLACDPIIGKNKEAVAFVKKHKEEIIEFINAEKEREERERAERRAKIDAIEGLKEIEECSNAWIRYYEDFNRFIANDGIGTCPTKPKITPEELCAKYPRASAYRKAEAYENASNYRKSAIGKETKEAIINGKPFTEVIDDMEKKWKAYCEEHIWD
jgi:hypothetical protein